MRLLTAPAPGRAVQSGFTLVELMIGLAIAAFLVVTAAPFLADYTTNVRLREAGSAVYAEALAAQSEAIRRNGTVRLAVSGSTLQVIDRRDPANPVVLRERPLSGNAQVAAATVDFGSEGRPVPFGTATTLSVSQPGLTCADPYRCPVIRIEAGGAVRLCADSSSTLC